MKLFIDTALIDQIREANAWGIVDGVTTNPTHVSKTGRPARDVYEEICRTVDGPVSLEVLGLEADQMVSEARELAKIADNAVIKVPITREGLKAVKRLTAEGIKTNVTVGFSPLQALLAAKCGATYFSPFVELRLLHADHRLRRPSPDPRAGSGPGGGGRVHDVLRRDEAALRAPTHRHRDRPVPEGLGEGSSGQRGERPRLTGQPPGHRYASAA